jgi:hypothetical protein
MGEPRVDRDAELLLATAATMDLLAGTVQSTPEQRLALERAGWLAGGRPPADLEPLITTWGSAVARIAIRIRHEGRALTIGGVTDGELAVLLVPAASECGLHHVLAAPLESMPRWVARAVDLGPRPAHGDSSDLVPLTWATVANCLGFAEEDSMRREARALATMMSPQESIDTVLAPDARRVTVTVTSTTGAYDESVDMVDAGDAGLWLVAALPPEGESAAAIPFSTRGIWQLLARAFHAPTRHAAGSRA